MSRAALVARIVGVIRDNPIAGWNAYGFSDDRIAAFCATQRQTTLSLYWYHEDLGLLLGLDTKWHRDTVIHLLLRGGLGNDNFSPLASAAFAAGQAELGRIVQRMAQAIESTSPAVTTPRPEAAHPTVWEHIDEIGAAS